MRWAVWVCACLCLLRPLCALAQEPVGLIKAATGDVTLVRQQTAQPATPGTLLYVGDTLQTGVKGSSLAVSFIDETRLVLGPQSRVILRQFVWNPTTQAGQMRAQLDRGTMAVQSGLLGQRQSGNTLDVTTPRATVRVTDAQIALRVEGKD